MKPITHTVAIILISICCTVSGYSKDIPYYFKKIGIEDGLSQSSVMSIIQDRQGFMWFATKDGVNRYDGIRFKTFSTDNTKGEIQDCIINVLYEAADGKIWAGTNKGVSIYDPEKEVFTQFNMHTEDGELRRAIKYIKEDKKGYMWIADFYRGIYRYDPKTDTLTHIKAGNHNIILPSYIHEDQKGTIWVTTISHGLFYYNAESGQFKQFDAKTSSGIDINNLHINSIVEIGREFYLGTYHHGLLKLNIEARQVNEVIFSDNKPFISHIHVMERMNNNEIWIGTDSGLYIYNEKQGSYINIKESHIDKYSLADNFIHSFCKDKDNGIWIGTYFGGISYLPQQSGVFNKFYPLNDGKTITGKVVRVFKEDNEGYIWIATEDAGLDRFDPKTGTFKHYQTSALNNFQSIRSFEVDGDKLWLGVFKGLEVMDTHTGQIEHYGAGKAPLDIYSILKDRTGNIWIGIGEQGGVYIYNKEADNFKKVDKIGNFFIHDIKEDYQGNIWFAAISNGVICYNPTTEKVVRYINNPNDETSVITKVLGIFEDSKNRLWFTSEGWGFCRFDRDTETFKRYTQAHGLPNSVIYYMTEDLNGILWLGTNKGLVSFDPETEKMRIFTTENGLLSNQFNYKSAITSKDGIVYMGTLDGFISFNPSTLKEKKTNSFSPILTSFQIFNKEVPIGEDSPLKKSISLTREITLNYKQNFFSFDFASLNYNGSLNQLYFYKLEGLDNDWLSVNKNQKISYSNLSPGQYVLKIKDDDNKETNHLKITITPPIWSTTYAYILYMIIALLLLIYMYKKINLKIKTNHQQNLAQMEARKERESYDAKIAFFTNVAHEVRTPLTLIKGPLEHILKMNKVDQATKDDLLVMQRNSDHLLALINQLLDFRKTESGKFSLSFVNLDIVPLLTGLYERFQPTFRQKNIEIQLNIPQESFFVDIDRGAFSKIVSNLLSNASKFATSYISLELIVNEANDNNFKLIVKNDGNIIKEEMFDKIFEPFFQLNSDNSENLKSGTGIGLSLSRSLAELHGGKLYLQKQTDYFNTFVLELPMNQPNSFYYDDKVEKQEKNLPKEKADRYSILIVEDNIEMQDFIFKRLNEQLIVYCASNGKEALKILDEEHIDIIISDIAMPEMDGFELLKNIKSNIKYSHIPTILLTAHTNLQSKIDGMELGADAYIEKPFSMDFLLAQILNLLNGRKILRDSFINSPYLHSSTIALTKADEKLMDTINEIVEQNLENIDFNIDQLASAMHTSRSSLLRKVKGVSGLTVNEYIRLIRLKKAAVLLEEGKYRINEICILTGFNSSSYFAKCFQKQFGILPKEFTSTKRKEE